MLKKYFAAAAVIGGVFAVSPSFAEELPLVIQADTVMGGQCVLSSQFKRNDTIVFRVRVLDTKTGEQLGDDKLTSVEIELADGTKLPAHFGEHPPEQPIAKYWTFGWVVPEDYPTGSFTYKITATDQAGNTATFTPFEVPPSQLTVVAAQ